MDNSAIAARSEEGLPDKPVNNGKVQLLTLESLDGRTLAARRAHQLVDAIEEDMGGDLTVSQKQMATHAAILGAMIEDMAANWLLGKKIDHAVYSTLINTQRRLLEALA
jgi:hypothetical protein